MASGVATLCVLVYFGMGQATVSVWLLQAAESRQDIGYLVRCKWRFI